MDIRTKKASSFTFLAILFSIPVLFGSFIAATAVVDAISSRVVHEPPNIMVSHETVSAEEVLWRLGSSENSLELVRVVQHLKPQQYGTSTTFLRWSRISDSYDINWKHQRAETTESSNSAGKM